MVAAGIRAICARRSWATLETRPVLRPTACWRPCLLTCVKELNPARYMSVGGIMECYQKPLEIYNYETLKDDPLIDVDTIGLKGSPTNVYKSFSPPVKGAGMMMEGADKATVEKLVSILNDKHII